MLLPNDKSPRYSLYYVGGALLKILYENQNHDLFSLYEIMKKQYDITFKLYVLTIDWLYLADIILMDSKGELNYVSKRIEDQ